ncbi:uncharacterized protein LOC114294507 [Camellia sinensis]|uniref:uncharacterized protein LOC114294507 n=1 Tax=Camellia sinensis TaxID=4442 RepID=UPI0010362C28|nr:uncharacterized protein LOC114294507 [Camellia sinensis]
MVASSRQRKNSLGSVIVNGSNIEDTEQIRMEVKMHFQNFFSERWPLRPKFLGSFEHKLSIDDAKWLELPFLEVEIWDAVRECEGNKAPGPDGFNMKFIRKRWPIIKEDICLFIKEFYLNCKLSKANEVVDLWKHNSRGGLLLKLDFEKAFDSVNWNFLLHLLQMFGFGEKWVSWIAECISSSHISVLVNGSPTQEFSPHRGLRQGDPLSPFLFNLVVEGLNILMKKAKILNLIKRPDIGLVGLNLTHLQFADDTLIFCYPDWNEIINLR